MGAFAFLAVLGCSPSLDICNNGRLASVAPEGLGPSTVGFAVAATRQGQCGFRRTSEEWDRAEYLGAGEGSYGAKQEECKGERECIS